MSGRSGRGQISPAILLSRMIGAGRVVSVTAVKSKFLINIKLAQYIHNPT